MTAGECFLSTDDDTLFQYLPSPDHPSDTLSLSGTLKPEVYRLSETEETFLEDLPPSDVHPLTAHEEWLGKPLSAVIDRFPDASIRVEHPTTLFLETLLRKEASIRIVSAGMAGDSGTSFPRHVLTYEGTSRRVLMGKEGYSL